MNTLNFPTKSNLNLARKKLALARKGYDILDKKRQVLVSELLAVQAQAQGIYSSLCSEVTKARDILDAAQAEIGRKHVQAICQTIHMNAAVEISFRSIMGAEVPIIHILQSNHTVPPYALNGTTTLLDMAAEAWQHARELIISWAAIENTVNRLKLHIKKTQKRANALGNIVIPQCEARIKYIQERLEERERDELARLKVAKGKRLT